MLEVKFKNGSKQAQMKFKEMDPNLVDLVFQKFFSFIDPSNSFEVTGIEPVTNQVKNSTEDAMDSSKDSQSPIQSRPRKLPLLNSDRSSFTMGDLLDRRKLEHVQTYYECPECEHIGTKPVAFGFRYTKCEACNTKLFLRPAAEEWGEKDSQGNVYVADEIYVEKEADLE